MTELKLYKLRQKLVRGSNGGKKQMVILSSMESIWLERTLECLSQDYPVWLESLLELRK